MQILVDYIQTMTKIKWPIKNTVSVGASRLITSSKPFHHLRYLPPCASDLAFADIACVYKFQLLTYSSLLPNLNCSSRTIYWRLITYSGGPDTLQLQVTSSVIAQYVTKWPGDSDERQEVPQEVPQRPIWLIATHLKSGARCKSKTGSHNQDQMCCATNHRRTLTWPVLIVVSGLAFATRSG